MLPMQNAGKVHNTGFELALTHRNQLNLFKYSASFNFSYVKNEITDLNGGIYQEDRLEIL